MITKEIYLVTLNAKNRIQRIKLSIEQDPISKVYTIHRVTGQYGGKETKQPDLTVSAGKAGRTAAEQVELQFNSLLQNYLDKGYSKLSNLTDKPYSKLSEDDIKNLLGTTIVSDQSGIPKPMLAKLADDCSADVWNKEWMCSRKLDGARMLMYYKDGQILTTSRGGKDYNASTKHLREDKNLISLFEKHPNLILDGELYKHDVNWPLQRISGTARLQEWNEECGNLEYWIYDYVSKEKFKDRYKFLMEIKNLFPKDSKIKILDHVSLTGYIRIKKEHDKYVQEGFEGLCARNPEKEYGVNKRSALYLIKLKERKDDEGIITGIKEGLRPEDMCFIIKAKNGKEFAAKPVGTVETRLNYLNNKDYYIGKTATYTYFTLTNDEVPSQPVFKCLRFKEDMPNESL